MKTCLVFVAIQHLLYAHSEASNEIDSRIENGQPANLTEIYYQVSVQRDFNATGNYTHICGGTVINLKTVLTAARCLYDKTNRLLLASNIQVVSGTVSLSINNSGEVRYVSQIVPHSSFKPASKSYEYDIAVLKLESPFPESTTLRAIEINTKGISDRTDCIISGYGNNQRILTRANVMTMKLSTCKGRFVPGVVTNNMMCAGNTESNFCEDDIGGPLVCNGKVAGISSHTDFCYANFPGIYTDVSKFTSWIVKNGSNPLAASILTIVFATLISYIM